jgi:ATP-binding cassette subfamily F protein 3
VQNLSGGEKTRLLLAIITRQAPHILILDEPTNHLDIEAKDALIEALNDYEGAVVLVSHDFYLIESVCDQLLLVKDHLCQPFTGDLDDYVEVVLAEKRAVKKSENTAKGKNQSPLKNEKKRKQITRELEKVEKIIAELTQQKKALEEKLSKNYIKESARLLDAINEKLSHQEQEWLNLSKSLETS